MKIKKTIVNILCLPIFPKKRRHNVKRILMSFNLYHWNTFQKFKKYKIKDNTILLIEANNCHGEVMAGYIKYFQQLGLNIDILINPDLLQMKPFDRCDMKNINIFSVCYFFMNKIVQTNNILNYKHIFLMTSAYYLDNENGIYPSVLDKLPNLANHKSLYVIEHDLNDIERFNENQLLKKNRLITLGNFNKGIMINPHNFGAIRITPKNKITTFITVGAIKAFRKNHQLLIEAVENLSKNNLLFKVVVVGLGNLSSFPEQIQKYLDIKGRLDFPEMFNEMENADFFLPLLDENSAEHNRYITSGVTGSAQLIYGFCKPCLIQQKFADFYGFDNGNSIVYENNLTQAMEKAISMNASEYNHKQNILQKTADEIYQLSIKNLKDILK